MIDALSLALTVTAAVAATVLGVVALSGRFRWARAVPLLVAVQCGVLVQAVLDVVGLVRGHHPREPVTHVAYLVATVLVVPVLLAETRRGEPRWAGVLGAVGLLLLAVLVVRWQTTWRS